MTPLIRGWADFVLANRLLILAATLIFLGVAIFTGQTIPFDNSTSRYFVEGDPTIEDYDRLLDLFGDNEYLIVGFEAAGNSEDIFQDETLAALRDVSEFLEFHPYVTQVRSLMTYQYIHANGDDLSTDYLIDDVEDLAADSAEVDRVKSILEQEDLAMGTLITEDFRHTRLAARVEYRNETSELKIELTQDLFRFVEEELEESDQYNLHLSGYPLLNERFETVSANDLALLIPIMVVVMILVLFLSFRSVAATVFPWLVIAGGVLLVTELQSYLQLPHTTVDSALVPTLIIIGIGIAVHVLVEFFNCVKAGDKPEQAAHAAILHIWRPALFTAITTSAGFLALSITRIVPVREFALLGAIGPIALFLFALTVLPVLLSYLPRIPEKTHTIMQSGLISRIASKVPDLTLRYRNGILVVGFTTLIFAVIYAPNIRVDTNYAHLFKEDSVTRQDIVYFDETFEGMMTLDMILDSGTAEGIKNPEFLMRLESLQAWVEQKETLGPVNSIVDYLKEISQALNGDDPAYYRLPDSPEMAAQFLLLYDSSGANEDLSDIRDFDNRYARLTVPIINMPASAMQVELADINAQLEANYSDLDPLVTGTMVLFTAQDIYTSEGMFQSFLIALLVISCFFIILFRSVKYGILSIIPSILPIILTGSLASMLGIYLDLAIMVVGAMTMGIAVDDAIHVMSRYLLAKEQGASTKRAIERAMNESGRAVIFSSMVLVLGFSVLSFASFTTVIYVGLFGAIIMSLALLGDLLFLPALLYLIDGDDDVKTEQKA